MAPRLHIQFSGTMDRLIKRILAMDRAEKFCYGVTLSQAYVISTLYKHRRIPMKELSSELGLAISTLTRIVDILKRDGIVKRTKDLNDRRKVLIELTEKGNGLAHSLQSCSREFWKKIIDFIPADQRATTLKCCETLLTAMEKAEEICCTKP